VNCIVSWILYLTSHICAPSIISSRADVIVIKYLS
jgi:hypothetical protein